MVKEYREVTLTQAEYKIYTSILAKRLREEVEKNAILPQNQTKFRRGDEYNG